MKSIKAALKALQTFRVAWLSEWPEPRALYDDAQAYLAGLREDYRYYLQAQASLERAKRIISAMIQDCEIQKSEIEQDVARLQAEEAQHAEGVLVGESPVRHREGRKDGPQ